MRGLRVYGGPAYLLDLNTIQNLWDVTILAVFTHFLLPATLRELETTLKEEWRLLASTLVEHLIESMITL